MRMKMTEILREHVASIPQDVPPPVMIFSDLDELPSRKTVQLLKTCEFESPLHLGMRSFLYSFEWEEGGEAESWRPQAWVWTERGRGPEEYYRQVPSLQISDVAFELTLESSTRSHRHGKVTDRILVDSGWHCSSVPFLPNLSRSIFNILSILPTVGASVHSPNSSRKPKVTLTSIDSVHALLRSSDHRGSKKRSVKVSICSQCYPKRTPTETLS